MRRQLPSQPHLDHLKKQAKDLLAAHKRGSAEAFARIRAAVPSFASLSDDAIARAPFALHDAQSAIAREYGLRSWSELRAEVTRRRTAAIPEELLRALMSAHPNAPLPLAVTEAVRDAWPGVGDPEAIEVPAALPLVAVRNALVLPGAIVPLHIGRRRSLAAIEAATGRTPATLALFTQRDAAADDVRQESLHPVGCHALLQRRLPDGEERAFVVLSGLGWIRLDGVEPASNGAYTVACVSPVRVDDADDAGEVAPLMETLRTRARTLAAVLPAPESAIALIDAIDDPERLGNLVVANLPSPVDDKARYAAEPMLAAKLRIAVAMTEAALAPEP